MRQETLADSRDTDQPGDDRKNPEKERRLRLRIQTPRGLWSVKEPKHADRRPIYDPDTRIQVVIDDARAVFGFVENDSKYTLFHEGRELNPTQSLESYHIKSDELLVLSVQGGNAA